MEKNHYEHLTWNNDELICGIDEAGRGSLFGPVVIAAAVLPAHTDHELLRDSKKMTPTQRNKAFEWIRTNALFVYIPINTNLIEDKNIYHATRHGMKRALYAMRAQTNLAWNKKVSCAVIDAMTLVLPNHDIKTVSMNKAEDKSSSVAAASIVAKVMRDKMMEQYDFLFPNYQLGKHKGYGTSAHTDAIKKSGATFMHRAAFVKNFTG